MFAVFGIAMCLGVGPQRRLDLRFTSAAPSQDVVALGIVPSFFTSYLH